MDNFMGSELWDVFGLGVLFHQLSLPALERSVSLRWILCLKGNKKNNSCAWCVWCVYNLSYLKSWASLVWWCTPLIPALGRQKQAGVWGQPGLQSEFQDSQGYTEKPCLKKPKRRQPLEQNANSNNKNNRKQQLLFLNISIRMDSTPQ